MKEGTKTQILDIKIDGRSIKLPRFVEYFLLFLVITGFFLYCVILFGLMVSLIKFLF